VNYLQFLSYKRRFRDAFRQVLGSVARGELDEAAFPAYVHSNPLINWLFWQRLHVVMRYMSARAPFDSVLDFGCGGGTMLPFLAAVSARVTAFDVEPTPLKLVAAYIPLAGNVQVVDATTTGLGDLPPASFDAVVALDVLEHVDDLGQTLSQLSRLTRKNGEIIVSGPTENWLYRVGRRIAGPEYSGTYHHRGIGEIRSLLDSQMTVRHLATLYWPVSLFEIFSARQPLTRALDP
jgi:2-polyprenyl-3-methyl-5-hydroxy-6-metoxy-1,4-benzoquinol methylase